MTATEFAEANPDLKFVFKSYYKYSFAFQCTTQPDLFGYIGGSGEDIYRLEVEAGKELTAFDMGSFVVGDTWYE